MDPRAIFPAANVKDAWRNACRDLRLAHEAWCAATPAMSRECFAVVVAAADREAAAAEALRRYHARGPAGPFPMIATAIGGTP
jgi:hypothetical protein